MTSDSKPYSSLSTGRYVISFAVAILRYSPEGEQNLTEISEAVEKVASKITSSMPRTPEQEGSISEDSHKHTPAGSFNDKTMNNEGLAVHNIQPVANPAKKADPWDA